jgi:Tfp pilus assembly protein PilE
MDIGAILTALRQWVWPTAREKLLADLMRVAQLAEKYGNPELGTAARAIHVRLMEPSKATNMTEELKKEKTAGVLSAAVKEVLLTEAMRVGGNGK